MIRTGIYDEVIASGAVGSETIISQPVIARIANVVARQSGVMLLGEDPKSLHDWTRKKEFR